MFCKKCGTDIGNAFFCPHCGEKSYVEETKNTVSGPKYCARCGTYAENSNFCPNCGTNISNMTMASSELAYVLTPTKKAKPIKRSLSFILFSILGSLAIVMCLIPRYAICILEDEYKGVTYDMELWNESFVEFANNASPLWAIIAIVLFAIPIILSLINFFTKNKAIAIINTVTTSISFIYMLITSIILIESHYSSFFGYSGTSHYHSFDSFDIAFYFVLTISLFMCVVSIFDTINKPIIKISK